MPTGLSIDPLLCNVSPCDCGSRTRFVRGFGVQAPGFVDLVCAVCNARSVMRPDVAVGLVR